MISGKSLRKRKALVSLFVCARSQFKLGGKYVLRKFAAMLDEVAWLCNLRGNEYARWSSRLLGAKMLI